MRREHISAGMRTKKAQLVLYAFAEQPISLLQGLPGKIASQKTSPQGCLVHLTLA